MTGLPNPTPTPRPMDTLPSGKTDAGGDSFRQVLATLEQGIAAIMNSEGFARYLRCLARFHSYSPNNVALILAQRPEATRVAGYRTWQALGRQVRRGERGIRIVVPYRTPIAPEGEEQRAETVAGWGARCVFDIAQTEGKPLIATPINGALIGDATVAEVVREELAGWLQERGVRLTRQDTGRANGYYNPRTREIAIHHQLTGIRELKTLVHEAAHFAADHCGEIRWEDAETVAESSAYVVLAHFGMDTSGYTFGYVAHWAREITVFRRNLAAIQQVAHQLIVAITDTGQPSVAV
jgi:antirestriction protein ArdC